MTVRLPEDFQKVVFRLLEDINTPRSLAISICLRHSDLRAAVSFRCDPMHYSDPEAYASDVMATDFLRKCNIPGAATQVQLEKECFERLLATERSCYETNQRLSRYLGQSGLLDQPGDARILELIDTIRKKIRWLVGPLPRDLTMCGFGPGATLTNPSRYSTIPDKIESVPCGTPTALYIYDLLYGDCAWERARGLNQRQRATARGNRFFTVPKTALTLRGAALSPNVNGFLQKGVGIYLRQRLTRANIHIGGQETRNGFSINDFTSADVHRRIARLSSKSEEYATIDLSDASNTIAKKLIELLWPSQWHSLLSDLREPLIQRPDGKWQLLEMFSAMGNGFTFELETITFWAIVSSLSDGMCSVFGDDIIVKTEDAADAIAALRFFGFKPNDSKTFTRGPFRESCGGDFFDGVPVRAHYVKEIPSAPEQWIALANGLRRFARAVPSSNRWAYVRRAWWAALDALPYQLRNLRGPEGLGDLLIHDPELFAAREKDGIQYWRVYAPVAKPVSLNHWKPEVVYASALYGVSSDGALARGSVSGYRVKWVPYS